MFCLDENVLSMCVTLENTTVDYSMCGLSEARPNMSIALSAERN